MEAPGHADGGPTCAMRFGSDAGQRVDHPVMIFLRRGLGHFFDVHAAFALEAMRHLLRGAVGDQRRRRASF